eukprot:gene11110-7822_t
METDKNIDLMNANKDEEVADEKTSKDYYFDSYSHFGIHEEMLKDEVRTLTYRKSIEQNSHLVKDKIVLDVGCGTGILSLFAAKSGASHVYAVDCSDIVDQARRIAADNGYADKITFFKGKMEDLELPSKVDVIISEWMGYALLYESMLNTVLRARDKYLNEGGILLPDRATIFLSGIEDEAYKADKIDWWGNVYGFDMTCMKQLVVREPLVDVVDKYQVVTRNEPIFDIDVATVTEDALSYDVPFTLLCRRNDYIHAHYVNVIELASSHSGYLTALVMHFDIEFSQCHKRVWFSTGAHSYYTHWKQTVFYLDQVLAVKDGEEIHGRLKCVPNERNHRDLNFELYIKFHAELKHDLIIAVVSVVLLHGTQLCLILLARSLKLVPVSICLSTDL